MQGRLKEVLRGEVHGARVDARHEQTVLHCVCKEWRTLQLFLRVSILPSHGDSKTHFNARNTPQRSPFAAGRRVLVPTGAKVN